MTHLNNAQEDTPNTVGILKQMDMALKVVAGTSKPPLLVRNRKSKNYNNPFGWEIEECGRIFEKAYVVK